MSSQPGQLVPRLDEIIAEHIELEGALLPILHAVQAEWGHIPEEALIPIATALNIGKAEIHGVVSFYHDFRREPRPAHVVRICRAEACQSMGGRALESEVKERLAGRQDVLFEDVYCLGLCACSPAAMVDGVLVARAATDDICGRVGA